MNLSDYVQFFCHYHHVQVEMEFTMFIIVYCCTQITMAILFISWSIAQFLANRLSI